MNVTAQQAAGWFAAWSAGCDAGERSRPTDAEIEAWAAELVERAYAAGYADGLAVDQHRQDARKLTAAATTGLDRAKEDSGYIPRQVAA